MNAGDTSLARGDAAFPATTWGMLSRLNPAAADYRGGLEQLCRRYWKPAYRYVRAAWAKSNEDAKDLAQAFFLWLFEGGALAKYESDRGSFRGYLKVLLRSFVNHQEEALQALKRGGARRFVPMDGIDLPAEAGAGDPEAAFDRAWVVEIVNQAIERVKLRLAGQNKGGWFGFYEAYDLVPEEERPTYDALAARHGLSWNELRARLDSVRDAVRSEIRAELAAMTRDDRTLEEEWNALFGR